MTNDPELAGWIVIVLVALGVVGLAVTYWPISLPLLALLVWLLIRLRAKQRARLEQGITDIADALLEERENLGAEFPILVEALAALGAGEAPSVAMLRRRLAVGNARAERIMGLLEAYGFVEPPVDGRRRILLVPVQVVAGVANRVRSNGGPDFS